MLSYEVAKRHGFEGLPAGTLHIKLTGHAGQTFGGWLARGITLELEGDANDYVGKGLSGGTLSIYPAENVAFGGAAGAEENIIIGNVAFYGAIKGRAFIRGMAAERFCVRNSGADVVIEGVGDHGCEYMTGGRAVILGETGRNFAAGMSGGLAYVRDLHGHFARHVNMGMVELFRLADQGQAEIAAVRGLIEEHVKHTGSTLAAAILGNWPEESGRFVKVINPVYRRIVEMREHSAGAGRGRREKESVHG